MKRIHVPAVAVAALLAGCLAALYLTRETGTSRILSKPAVNGAQSTLVDTRLVETARRVAEETAKAEGKPEQALPKIIEGRLTGFFKDVVLLDQPSVSDSKKSVKALLDEAGVTITRFVRFEVGQN